MNSDPLRLEHDPQLGHGRLIAGFSGWMDGGEVSTGTIKWLNEALEADTLGHINPEGFYIYNFPGSMEISALFRPATQIHQGLIQSYDEPENLISTASEHELLLFAGKEPHLHWQRFADALFKLAKRAGVEHVYFVGSVGGMVPHTREPILRATVSEPSLKPAIEALGVGFTDYEGPASFTTYLLQQAAQHSLKMTSLVAEIPAYIQGKNPKAIHLVLRNLSALLSLTVDLEPLRDLCDHWEKRIDEAVQKRQDLAEHIQKLEEDYDHDVFDNQMGDLKDWLEQQGIKLD